MKKKQVARKPRVERTTPALRRSRVHPAEVELQRGEGGEGTSTSATDNKKFKEEHNQQIYTDLIGPKEILLERRVDFKSFEDNNAGFVSEWFKFQGWSELLAASEPMYPDVVRQFYSHIDLTNQQKGIVISWVKGKKIKLDEAILGKILGVPSEGIHDYPGNKWSNHENFDKLACIKLVLGDTNSDLQQKPQVDELPMPSRLLHLILMQSIMCRAGRKSSLTYLDMFVMFCILGKKKMNLPRMIIDHIITSRVGSRKGSLPYGTWLTKVFTHFGVDLSEEVSVKVDKNHSRFDIRTIQNSIGYKYDCNDEKWIKTNLKRAPRKRSADEALQPASVRPEGSEATNRGRGGSNALLHHLLVETLFVKEMLRRSQPTLFTDVEMEDIKRVAHANADNRRGYFEDFKENMSFSSGTKYNSLPVLIFLFILEKPCLN